MKLFRQIGIILVTALACQFVMLDNIFADDGWHSPKKAIKLMKRLDKEGRAITSIKCRNAPHAKKRLSPQVSFKHRKDDGTGWHVLLSYNVKLELTRDDLWRVVSRSVVSSPTNSGAKYACTLYYRR